MARYTKHTIEECNEQIQWWTDLKAIMEEGAGIISQGAQPQTDETQQNRIAKVVYITLQSVPKAAQWLLDNIPGYATGKDRARQKLTDCLYTECAGDPVVDEMAADIREWNCKHAYRKWG